MTAGRKPVFLKQIWHRLVGVRGTIDSGNNTTTTSLGTASTTSSIPCATSSSQYHFPINNMASSNFGKLASCRDIADYRLVFLGEIHSMPPIIAFQRQVQAEMINQQRLSEGTPKVHVVLEHFSFEHQDLLNEYMKQSDGIDFDELLKKYKELGQEGHDLEAYRDLLEDAKKASPPGMVQLHAGFLPRKYARMWIKEGPEVTRKAASEWLPNASHWMEGTEFHYNVFESFFTGRSIFNTELTPTDQFRNIFQAQVLKDIAMANKINQLVDQASNPDEKLLVIAGNGHLKHYCGVPERVLAQHPELTEDACLVISESSSEALDNDESIQQSLRARFGETGPYPADYVYLYRLPEEDDEDEMEELLAAAKEETKKAYDKVGESAALPGNMAKAAWIMYNMGYTEEQFHVAGPDAYNFQGVGNPHIHAHIQPGESVVDVGSGLGVDSFIALHATGSTGNVIGIDLSAKEVKHSQQRATKRGLSDKNLRFMEADMEKIPLDDNSVDVIISNGAFCLAPNKEKAFRELFRILKPGGRISVCTTTIQKEELQPGVDWPLCMKMFVAKKDLLPMCQEIGFTNVLVDDSDSSMTMEIPESVLKDTHPRRNKVHVGGDDFKHLEDFDMDEICARVCIVATKPETAPIDD